MRPPLRTCPSAPACAALLACVLGLALTGCGDGAPPSAASAARPLVPTATVETATTGAPAAPTAAPAPQGQLVVQIERPTALRARPGGRAVVRLMPTTSFRSPTVVPVVRERRGWLGVLAPGLANGQVGWIAPNAAVKRFVSSYRLDASLAHRQVVVRDHDRVIARFPVAIGGPSTPTPTARFAVTDKLLTQGAGSPYGCCIIALNARQTHTPQGWGGGDRVAIHTTDRPGTIGSAVSLGCLRAPEDAMRRIIRVVPLGTIVTIRA